MSTEFRRLCPICGNEFSKAMGFCPVCMLNEVLAGGTESGERSSEDTVKHTPERAVQRFEHYELVMGEDGKPVDLRCPVTLKEPLRVGKILRETLQGLRTTVNLSPMDAAPLGLPMFLVFGSSGRERQKLGVLAKAR